MLNEGLLESGQHPGNKQKANSETPRSAHLKGYWFTDIPIQVEITRLAAPLILASTQTCMEFVRIVPRAAKNRVAPTSRLMGSNHRTLHLMSVRLAMISALVVLVFDKLSIGY
jgi:hypothetical protein